MQRDPVDISIIVPVKDEEESIPGLAREIVTALEARPWPWECLWIDDGSTDRTLPVLEALCAHDPRHRFVSFARNAGQSAALWAGFQESRGDILATLDGDGQNDPADLPRLIQLLLDDEADMVNGFRQRRADSLLRKISSRIGNGCRNLVTGRTVSDVGCATRCFRRACVRLLPPFAGLHRFLPTLVALHGYRLVELPVNHRPRLRGKTKYSVGNRLWVGIYDLFGVRWLIRRAFTYKIRKCSG